MLPRGRAYKETTDQEQLSARLDLALLADRSQPFQVLERALAWLLVPGNPALYPYRFD
jgi:hypothetical protein